MDRMKKVPAFSASVAALAAVLAFSASTGGAVAQTMPGEALLLLDVDKDGQVGADEYSDQMDTLFKGMDTNANGQIEYGEVESFMGRDLFDPADTDQSGALSKQEYDAQIQKDFEAADRDDDGELG